MLTGKVIGEGESLPSAHVRITNSSGVAVGTSLQTNSITNMDGEYSIELSSSDYLTASYVGFPNKTIKASDVCSQNSCNFDFKLDSDGNALDELIITAKKCGKKCEKKRIIATGVGLAVILIGTLIYKKVKK
jgi:hypothetical protein